MNEQVTAAAIRLHPADNVVVAARAMPAGAVVAGESGIGQGTHRASLARV